MFKKIFSLILVFALIGTMFSVVNANEGSDSEPLFTYQLSDDFAYSQGVSNWYYMVHPRINNIPFAAANLVNMKATATSSTKVWSYASGNSTAKIYIDSNGPIFLPSTLAGGALVAFKAPLSGKITIDASGVLKRTKPGASPSGAAVNCYVFKGGEQLSLTAVPDNGDTGIAFTKLTDISVNKGEYIYFFTDSAAGSSKDTKWDPVITYTEVNKIDDIYTLRQYYTSEEQGKGNFYYMYQPDMNNFDVSELELLTTKDDDTLGLIWACNRTLPYIYMAGRSLKDNNGDLTEKLYPVFSASAQGRNAVLAWKAPYSGVISVTANGNITAKHANTNGSGIKMPCRLYLGDEKVWEGGAPRAMNQSLEFPEKQLCIEKGEYLYFTVERYNEKVSDVYVAWDPIITYVEKGTSSVYELTTLVYKGEEEVELSDIAANETANIYVEVSAYTDNIINGKVIVALYNGDKVVGIKVADYNNAGVTLPVTLTEDGSNLEMKVFVVKSLVSLTPICRNF